MGDTAGLFYYMRFLLRKWQFLSYSEIRVKYFFRFDYHKMYTYIFVALAIIVIILGNIHTIKAYKLSADGETESFYFIAIVIVLGNILTI